eukprot:m.59111 g.59111  ORF g.59111 m.59111 type:complete len:727 (+) comp9443_c0_seq1:100-2280(+)
MDDVDVIDLCDSAESADDEVTLVESESDTNANDPHSPEPIYVSSDSDSGSLTVSETLLTRAHEPAEALSSPRNCEDLSVESKLAGCASSSTASDRPARCALGPSDAIGTLSRVNARLNRQTPSPSKASNTRSSPRHGDILQFLSPRRAGKVPMSGSAPGTSPQGTSVPVAAARSLSWCGTSNSAGGAGPTIEGLDGRSPPLRIKAEKHGHAYSPLRNYDLAKYAIDAKSANSVCPNVKIESRTDCETSVQLAPKPQDGGPAEIGTWQAESDSLENVKVESSSDSDTAVVSLPRRAVAKQSNLHRPGTGESARNPHSDSDSENPTLRLVRPYIRFDSGSESDQISVASRKRKRRGDTPHDRGAPLPSSEQKRRIQDESSSSDNNYITVQGSHQDTDSRRLDNGHPSNKTGMSTQNSDSQRRKYRHQRSASVYAAKSIVSIAGGGSDNDSATDSSDACAGCGEAGPTVECARCNLPFHSGCIESRSNKPHVVCGNCRKQQSAKRRRRARIGNVKLEMAGAQDGRVQGSHGLQQSVEKVPLLIMDTKEPSCEQPFTESARSKRKRLQDHTTAVLETLGGEISFERLCAGLRTPTTITSAADKNSLKSSVLCPKQGCVRQFATWKGLAWHLAGGGCESAAGGDLFESSNDESCTFQCHWHDCNKACSSAANLVRHLSKDHLTDDARLRGCLWRRCDDIGPVSTDEVEPASFFVAHVAAHVFSDLSSMLKQ